VKLPNNSEQTNDDANDRLLKKRELAKRLGISNRTLDDWQRRGRIVHLKIGRSCRYRWDDVIAKLQEGFRVN
jgi:excisionase family DNA binding protein